MAIREPPRLDPQTRRWLKQEVSRRRKEKELHVGRPVLHRYSKQGDRDTVEDSPDATAVFDTGAPREAPKVPLPS